jgi:hypothetical protein
MKIQVHNSEWLLFNAKLSIYQQYHGENKLPSIIWCPRCTRLLKQQSAGRHVAPLWHIILIPSHELFNSYQVHVYQSSFERPSTIPYTGKVWRYQRGNQRSNQRGNQMSNQRGNQRSNQRSNQKPYIKGHTIQWSK